MDHHILRSAAEIIEPSVQERPASSKQKKAGPSRPAFFTNRQRNLLGCLLLSLTRPLSPLRPVRLHAPGHGLPFGRTHSPAAALRSARDHSGARRALSTP